MGEVLLSDETSREIAMRCGRGWYRADKPLTALIHDWQLSRLANYRRVIAIAPQYIRGRDGMSRETCNAIWAHVCAETDLLWRASE